MHLEKPIFCFHSVCSLESLPPSSCWPSETHFDMFSKHLRVDDEWFTSFIQKAQAVWGDFSITFDDGYMDCVIPAIFAASKGIDTTVFVSFDHVGRQAPFSPLPMLRDIDLYHLAEHGVRIGSHGMKHRDWKLLPDNVVRKDIFDSFNQCQTFDFFSKLKTSFRIAPPHGSFYNNHVDMCTEIGFDRFLGVDCPYTDDYVSSRVLACASGYRVGDEEFVWPWGG